MEFTHKERVALKEIAELLPKLRELAQPKQEPFIPKVGDWVKLKLGSQPFYVRNKYGTRCFVDDQNKNCSWFYGADLTTPTNEEICKHLKKIAIEKGYVGKKVFDNGQLCTIRGGGTWFFDGENLYASREPKEWADVDGMSNPIIWKDGQWAKIVEVTPVEEKKLTYEDVVFELEKRSNNYSSLIKKKLAIEKLLIVAKYLNKDWKPVSGDYVCEPCLKDGKVDFVYGVYNPKCVTAIVYFKTVDDFKKCLEILGEETIKAALSQEY